MMNQKPQEINTLYAPIFSDEWKEQSLYPLADWLNGMAFRDFNFSSDGKPVIKIAEIKNGISGQTKFTNEKYDSKYLLKKGDMLFCWSGQPQTSIDVFWWSGPEGWLNQHIFKVTTKLESKFFFFYLLKYLKPNFVQIAINKQTTGLGHVTKGDLERFIVKLPKTEEQRAIAAVLSSLDDKIELLQEQNKTLEATAQAIFKEWFVNFNFPGAIGKMIDSELGEIPEGWRVGKIKDLIDILSGFAFSSSDFSQDGNYKLVTIKNVQDRHFDPETKDRLSALPVRMPEYCKLNSGDILLSLTGNVGRICLVNGDNFLLNQRVAKLKEKTPSDYAFTYLLFLQDSIFSLLQSTASGTAQQNLSPIQTKEIEIIIADRKTLDQFGMVANKLIQKINDNNSQVETLSKLRDTLLPKLMTGNVRVKGFED